MELTVTEVDYAPPELYEQSHSKLSYFEFSPAPTVLTTGSVRC